MPQAHAVVAWVERVLRHALGAAADDLTSRLGLLTEETALLVQDAAMLGTAVGHCGVVVRRSVLWTTKAPQYSNTRCRHPDCQNPATCSGNILEEVAADPALEGMFRSCLLAHAQLSE